MAPCPASTSFANPAVTIARAFTDTCAGIRATDVPGFVCAQLLGTAASMHLFDGWCRLSPDTAEEVLLSSRFGSSPSQSIFDVSRSQTIIPDSAASRGKLPCPPRVQRPVHCIRPGCPNE